MPVLVSSFEGGTPGTSVSAGNSGAASGNAFDAVSIGTGAAVAYDSAEAAHGILGCKISTGVTSSLADAQWSSSMGAQTQAWFRQYLFFTANPGGTCRILTFLAGASTAAAVKVLTSGVLQITDANNSQIFVTASTIPLNQWFRIEGFITGSASAGQVELRLYEAQDSTSPDEVHTSAATQNTAGSLTNYIFGLGAATASIGPYWMDDLGLSSSGYLGPAGYLTAAGMTAQPGYRPRWAPHVQALRHAARIFQPQMPQSGQGVPFPTFTRQAGHRPRWKPQERLVSSRRRMWWPPQPLPYLIGANDADAVGSVVITVTTPVNPGDTIVVGAGSGGAATATAVSDSQGNKYQLAGSTAVNSSNNSGYAFTCLSAAKLSATPVPDTITVTFSSAQNGQAAIAAGVPAGYAMPDQAVSAVSASSASPSVTTSHALSQPETLLAVLVSGNAGNAPAWNAGWAPLSTRHHAFGDAYTSMAFELASSGNVTAGATIAAANYALVMVTLAQGQAFPVFTRRAGCSPLRWAPPARVTRSRIFQPQMAQGNQGTQFPLWTRQAGFSPRWAPHGRVVKRQGQAFQPPMPQALVPYLYKLSPAWRLRWVPHAWRGRFFLQPIPQGSYQKPVWIRQAGSSPRWLPDRHPARGRKFEPGWGQGALGQPYPSVTRQPGWHPRWTPFIRQVRGRLFQPPAPITDSGTALLSGTGTLTATALVTELPSAFLASQASLNATAVLVIRDSASLSAAGMLAAAGAVGPTVSLAARAALTVLSAFAGPDPAGLWLVFQAAQRAADIAEKSWEETVIAGGTGGQSGMAYTKVYQLQLASSQAYAAWLAAHDAWLAAGEPGEGPG